MDSADFADRHIEAYRELALGAIKESLGSRRPSARHCQECGEPIPEARRRAVPGVQHCVICADMHEHGHHHAALAEDHRRRGAGNMGFGKVEFV